MRLMPPPGARDLDDLVGDAFIPTGTPLHDKPPMERQRALQDALDAKIARKQEEVCKFFGDPPEGFAAFQQWQLARQHWLREAENDIRRQVLVNGQVVPEDANGDQVLEAMMLGDGHIMPTTPQGAIDGVSASDFQADDERRAIARDTGAALWEDYVLQYGGDDPAGVERAAQAVTNELRSRGVSDINGYIKRNRDQFMEATNWWHRRIIDRDADAASDGRTAGLSGWGSNTPGANVQQDDRPSTTEDILHELQRQRGW